VKKYVIHIQQHEIVGLLASGSSDSTIKLWNVKTGECIRTLTDHNDTVLSVTFDKKGILASGSLDKHIKLWNVTTGECITTLTGHENYVKSVSFDREGLGIKRSNYGTDTEFFCFFNLYTF